MEEEYLHNFVKNSRDSHTPRPADLLRIDEEPRLPFRPSTPRRSRSPFHRRRPVVRSKSPVPQSKTPRATRPKGLLPLLLPSQAEHSHSRSFIATTPRIVFTTTKGQPQTKSRNRRTGNARTMVGRRLPQDAVVRKGHRFCRSPDRRLFQHPLVEQLHRKILFGPCDQAAPEWSESDLSYRNCEKEPWEQTSNTRIFEDVIAKRRVRLGGILKQLFRAKQTMERTPPPAAGPDREIPAPRPPRGKERPESGLAHVIFRMKRLAGRKLAVEKRASPRLEVRKRQAGYGRWYLQPGDFGRNLTPVRGATYDM